MTTLALRDLQAGEELLTSYTLHLATREDRVLALAKWHFLCQCPACSLLGEQLAREDRARAALGEMREDPQLVAYIREEGERLCQEDLWSLLDYQSQLLSLAQELQEVAVLERPRLMVNSYLLFRLVRRGEGSELLEERVMDRMYRLFGVDFSYHLLKDMSIEISSVLGKTFQQKIVNSLNEANTICEQLRLPLE